MHQIHKFILSWNSTCFGQFVCPSSGVCSLHTQQLYVHVIRVCRQLSSRTRMELQFHPELSKTCRVSWQNQFVKLVHLVGFITKKFGTMHGHMNVKKSLWPLSMKITIEVVGIRRNTVTWVLKQLFLLSCLHASYPQIATNEQNGVCKMDQYFVRPIYKVVQIWPGLICM